MKPSKRPCPNNGGSAPCHCSPKLIRLLQHRKVPGAPPSTARPKTATPRY